MKVYFSKKFTQQYRFLRQHHPKLAKKLKKRVEIFIKNPYHPLLKTHPLSGKLKGKKAFWISWDLRIVFDNSGKNKVRFLALGRHDQIYK